MKIFSAFIGLLFIVGCSSQKVAQNSINIGHQIDEKLLAEIQLKTFAASRAPASVEYDGKVTSAKRVYFKTLYQQYLAFTKLSGQFTQINHCPAFHLDFLEITGMEIMNSSPKAAHRVAVLESELRELCDKGVTSNYYRFENLVTYHTNKSSFHQDPRSIFSLLKIPVFQNMFELKLNHGIVLGHSGLLDLTKTFWFSSYLDQHKVNRSTVSFRE